MPNSKDMIEAMHFYQHPNQADKIRRLRAKQLKPVKCLLFMHEWIIGSSYMKYCKHCGKTDFGIVQRISKLKK